jgi:glycosyltransferase involved in cell wall biosynthesis
VTLSLTVVIPVKNEAPNLPACLASIPAGVSVLVADSSSTDATAHIALAAGARVTNFVWTGGFPKKRNWVLQNHRLETDWVLFLDADERLTPDFIRELEGALARPDVAGYWLHYRNRFMGRVLSHGIPQRKLALFRVGAGLYERIDDAGWSALDMEVHEHPVLAGSVGEILATIDHDDDRGLAHFIARHNEYSSWEAARYTALMADSDAWTTLTRRQRWKYGSLARWWFAPAYFLVSYLLRGGVLDGGPGLIYALLKCSYFLELRLKIMEMTPARSTPIPVKARL